MCNYNNNKNNNEIGIEIWTILIMKSGKQQMIEGIELLFQRRIRMLGEKET